MKSNAPLVYSKPLNRQPEQNSNALEGEGKKPKVTERIVDRLDLQLLLAVIVFFVSAWAFLNGRICNFTGSEPINVQMSYILVHYILTLVLVLCVCITAVKGNFVLREDDEDISDENVICSIKLFIEGWFPTLLLCVGVLITSSIIPWYLWFLCAVVLLVIKLKSFDVTLPSRLCFALGVIILFPIFVSTMTIVEKEVDVVLDKDYYSLSDDVTVSIQSKGYACRHSLVCLGDPHSSYTVDNNKIILPASYIENGSIYVGTVSPASGFQNFFVYPYRKIFNLPIQYPSLGNHLKERAYFTSKQVIVR